MKSAGVVRRLDRLGRFVIPIEIRNILDIENAEVEIFLEDDRIVLKKYEPLCSFCGNPKDLIEFKNKRICKACIAQLSGQE